MVVYCDIHLYAHSYTPVCTLIYTCMHTHMCALLHVESTYIYVYHLV